jgi:hypothetical protein
MYWIIRKMNPNRVKKAMVTDALATLNRMLRKIRISGSSDLRGLE